MKNTRYPSLFRIPSMVNSRLPAIITIVLSGFFIATATVSGQVEYGIAAGFARDSGIAQHPGVIFTEDFEEATITGMHNRWSDEGEVQRGEFMEFSGDVPPFSSGRQSLTAPGNDEGPGLYRRLIGEGTGFNQLYLRFYGKLDPSCDEIHHYSWIGGYNPPTKWPNPRAGYVPAGDSHFSSGAEPGADGWDFYTYWKDMGCWGTEEGQCHGNCFLWNNTKPKVVKGEWFCWEMMIKVNDPPGAVNGEQAFWINGVKYAHFGPGFPDYAYSGTDRWGEDPGGSSFPGFQWRTVDELKVNYVWIYNYVHDDVCRAWFDDVVVATSYIGPMVDRKQSIRAVPESSRNGIFSFRVTGSLTGGTVHFLITHREDLPAAISIFDMTGNAVAQFSDIRGREFAWNGQSSQSGMYIVKAACGNRQQIRHFTLVH